MVHGEVKSGFEPVRDAFERCFTELGETGASFAATVGGEVVADLWGGRGYERDSLVNVYSVSKPAAAFCVVVLADRNELSYEERVATYWPEFGQAGKQDVTVRQLLSHQAGLVAIRKVLEPDALFRWDELCATIAAEEPWWDPGTGHAEHALFYGHLCGELVRRVDGRTLGSFWREEVARPWDLDFLFALNNEEIARVVDLEGAIEPGETELYVPAVDNPLGAREIEVVNTERWRRAEIPAINGHASALGVARFFAGLEAGGVLDGVQLVKPESVAAMSKGELTDVDPLLGEEVTWGFGVWVDDDGFGMGGLGGSFGMTDPDLHMAEAYVTRKLADHDRSGAMDEALRAAIAASS